MSEIDKLIKNCVLLFQYGSTVYGTTTKHSDIDMIGVVADCTANFDEYPNSIYQVNDFNNKIQYNFITESTWIRMIKEHHIYALEGLWTPKEFIHKTRYDLSGMEHFQKMFQLDKWKLRQTISSIAENAYAKCHKKLTIEKNFDLYRAKKSLFHSLRILDFGKQIAEHGYIIDYGSSNHLWDMIQKMETSDWEEYKKRFKPILNSKRTEFVKLCPKPIK